MNSAKGQAFRCDPLKYVCRQTGRSRDTVVGGRGGILMAFRHRPHSIQYICENVNGNKKDFYKEVPSSQITVDWPEICTLLKNSWFERLHLYV